MAISDSASAEECGHDCNHKKKCCKKDPKNFDLFRDTKLRYLGYANELGEAFRGLVAPQLVLASYVVAAAYVVADTGAKASETYRRSYKCPTDKRHALTLKQGLDTLIWQSFASVIIPGFTINRIVLFSRQLACRSRFCCHAQLIGTAVGLASIPFIIRPIDCLVDAVIMDKVVRPLLSDCHE